MLINPEIFPTTHSPRVIPRLAVFGLRGPDIVAMDEDQILGRVTPLVHAVGYDEPESALKLMSGGAINTKKAG
jgi:hypothetical protein